MRPCPASVGNYVKFFAEIGMLCALSPCPGGELSKLAWAMNEGVDPMLECWRQLEVEFFRITDPEVLQEWGP